MTLELPAVSGSAFVDRRAWGIGRVRPYAHAEAGLRAAHQLTQMVT
jgi:hypothetical protein